MINFNEDNKSPILNIPAYSFIAYLSQPFHNRQQQLTYAVSTSIFSTEFYVDLNWFESMIGKIIRKSININIIIPKAITIIALRAAFIFIVTLIIIKIIINL